MNIKIAAATLLTALALTGCSSTPSALVGEPKVYESIAAETDCAKLQSDFDLAVENGDRNRENGKLELAKVSTAYMDAIFDRQEELKCFG